MPRKHAERSDHSQLNERHMAAIVESSDDAIIGKTLDGVIISWNTAAARMYGYTAEEAIGQSISMLVPEGREDEIPGILSRIARGESVDHFDTVRRRKDGRLVEVSLTVSPVLDANGSISGASAIARDITKQRALARALERTTDDLREANRALREFTAVASHDLQSPLASILGFASTLSSRWDRVPEERRREFVDVIKQQAKHMARLVDDLLLESTIEASALRPDPVAVPVGEALARAAGQHGFAETQLELRPEPGVAAHVDPTHLDRILDNLLTNAFKHGAPPVRVEAREHDRRVEIRVRDAGPGVPESFVPHLFERFARADTGQQGTGLGLAIVRGLAEANGGHVRYEPAPGQGAIFRLTLPAAQP